MRDVVLSVRDLCVDYVTPRGLVRAVDRVSLDLRRGEMLGVAGESGCGKSTLARAILRILPAPAVISRGSVLYDGRDVLAFDDEELRALRWRRISIVVQSAMNALNPVIPVGEQIVDTLRAHGERDTRRARERAGELLELVGVGADRLRSYAHQLSGGMRQRTCIALALALEPDILILDEPTTALDVIVEREILDEIRRLQAERGFSALFITHDLARMLEIADRVAVFYAARLAELGPADELRRDARHPYTRALMRAFPTLSAEGEPPASIPGAPPSLEDPPSGCRFHPRCTEATEACRQRDVAPVALGADHVADCRLVDSDA